MAKKIDYTNVELSFPHELFLKGEELYEAGGVVEINKLDKSLFSFTVREGGNIEVEWLKPLSKNQKASCECDFFKIGKMCKHVVAALIAYKYEIAKTPEEKPEVEVQSKKFASLNINSILNNLTKEDLRSFVKAYAATDKKFATSFKVHFARKVDLQDNEKKYKSILDSIIRPVSSDKNPFKSSEVRQLLNVTDEFLSQADDAMALSQYYEALLLIKTSLVKLCYTLHYAPYAEQETEKAINAAHARLMEIAINNESVDLKNELIDFLVELVQLSYYPFINVKLNAVTILLFLNALPDHYEEIFELQLKRKMGNEKQTVVINALKIMIEYATTKNYGIDKKHQSLTDKIAAELFYNEMYEQLAEFAQYHKSGAKDTSLYYLHSLVIKNSKKIASEAAAYFIENRDLRIVDLLKQKSSEELFEKFRTLVSKSKNKVAINPQIYMQYLLKTSMLEDLMAFLEDKKDFRYLMQYDDVLLKVHPDKVISLYETMVEDFLNKHVGEQSLQFIDELIIHLNKIKATKVVNRIGMLIEMKFPHRSRLDEKFK